MVVAGGLQPREVGECHQEAEGWRPDSWNIVLGGFGPGGRAGSGAQIVWTLLCRQRGAIGFYVLLLRTLSKC